MLRMILNTTIIYIKVFQDEKENKQLIIINYKEYDYIF